MPDVDDDPFDELAGNPADLDEHTHDALDGPAPRVEPFEPARVGEKMNP